MMIVADEFAVIGRIIGMYMCHGFCEFGAVPFDSALTSFKTFLVESLYPVVLGN